MVSSSAYTNVLCPCNCTVHWCMFMDFVCTLCLVAFLSFLLLHKLVHVLYTHVFPCTGSEQAALVKDSWQQNGIFYFPSIMI